MGDWGGVLWTWKNRSECSGRISRSVRSASTILSLLHACHPPPTRTRLPLRKRLSGEEMRALHTRVVEGMVATAAERTKASGRGLEDTGTSEVSGLPANTVTQIDTVS